jgi:hypothetical protein
MTAPTRPDTDRLRELELLKGGAPWAEVLAGLTEAADYIDHLEAERDAAKYENQQLLAKYDAAVEQGLAGRAVAAEAKLTKVEGLVEQMRPWVDGPIPEFVVPQIIDTIRELLAEFAPPPPTFTDEECRLLNGFVKADRTVDLTRLAEAAKTDPAVRALLNKLTEGGKDLLGSSWRVVDAHHDADPATGSEHLHLTLVPWELAENGGES